MSIKGKIGGILGIPIKIAGKLGTATKEVGESYQYQSKTKFLNLIYTTDYAIRIIKADFAKDHNWFIPKDINKRFRLKKTYTDQKGETWAIVNNNNPASIDLDKPLIDYKGTKRKLKIAIDKEGNEIQTIDLEDFTMKGGDILSDVAYDIGNFPFMNLFKIASRNELLYTLAIGLLIGIGFGRLVLVHII